jgi:hypothetical protein
VSALSALKGGLFHSPYASEGERLGLPSRVPLPSASQPFCRGVRRGLRFGALRGRGFMP